MKRLPVLAAVTLAGCSTPGEMTARLSQPETLAAAVQVVESYNAIGVDPVKLDEKQRAIFATTCLTFAILSPIVSPPEDAGITAERMAAVDNLCHLASVIAE